MQNLPTIHSFLDVSLNTNHPPLVICDIDYTFIRPDLELPAVASFLQNHKKYSHPSLLYDDAYQFMDTAYNSGIIRQTDPRGFQHMLNTIQQSNGKLIFLTARSAQFHSKTLYDLFKAGLEIPEQYEIHYTNNIISKGEYLKHIDLSPFQHIYFIDDNLAYIDSVRTAFPNIHCYQFHYI
jgi:hypothetical protein